MDANIDVINLKDFIDEFKDNDMVVFDHNSLGKRCCIYEEAIVVKQLELGDVQVINKQINKYRELGFPKNNGLICGGIILRKNNDVVNDVMDKWWDEIKNGSVRDQLSFNFVSWYKKFEPHYIKMDIRNNKFFKISRSHNYIK